MLTFFEPFLHKTAAVLTASLITVVSMWLPTANQVVPAPQSPSPIIAETTVVTSTASTTAEASSSVARIVKSTAPTSALLPKQKITTSSAADFLNKTKILLKQRLDGTYWPQLETNGLKWDPGNPTVGGDNGTPKYEVSFSCDPAYDQVPPAIYSSVSLNIRTKYSCELRLIDNAAGRIFKKEFNFTTGAGLLVVSKVGDYSDALVGDRNGASVIFTNTDDNPVTITEMVMDVTVVGINEDLAFIRFSDFGTGDLLSSYPLKNTTVSDPSKPDASSESGVKVPLALTVAPHSTKRILIEALNTTNLGGEDHEVNLVFNKINIDQTDMAVIPMPLSISWSCIARYLPFDSGRMCH